MKMDLQQPALQPFDVAAERAILGAIMLDPTRLADARDHVCEQDFYQSVHRSVFSTLCHLADDNHPIDQITVTDQLKRDGQLEAIGAYLAELWGYMPSASNLVCHCQLVRDHAKRRQLIALSQQLLEDAYATNTPMDALLDNAEQSIFALTQERQGSEFHSIGKLTLDRLDYLQELYDRKSDMTGLSSGFPSIDRMTAGLQAEDLIIIAARPSMGKTALALTIGRHVAMKLSRPVGIFSLEMSKAQLTDRVFSGEARIDAHVIRTGQLDPEAWKRLAPVTEALQQAPLFIDDTPILAMPQLRTKARRLKTQQGLDLLIIDYLQLMQLPHSAESREQGIAEISRDLKLLARELRIPVIALAQLNRNVEARADRRPGLADLRDSGAIEQDADVVMFLYRDEFYDVDSSDKGIAEVLIKKHRNGPTGDVRLVFLEKYVSFSEI